MHVRQLVIKLIGEIKGELMQANVSTNYQAINLFGIKIHALTMDELINICGEHISRRDSLLLGVINVAS